jgi:hypothetical protein
MLSWLKIKDWQSSPAHLLLLSKFRNGDSPTRYQEADYWKTVLGEKPIVVIEQLIKEGMLKPAGLPELVNYKFKAPDLKSMLKASGLKISGRKEELIQRLIDNNEKLISEAIKDIKLYQCTETGLQLTENYLATEQAKRKSAEREAFDLLAREEYTNAALVVAQYEASQVFPRGLGIDWKNYNATSDAESLKVIFNSVPEILQHITKTQLTQLRLTAGMMLLWGTNKGQKYWLPDGIDTGIHLDSDTACRMFVFYASNLRKMKHFKEIGARAVKILGTNDGNTCSKCREINNEKYSIESAPELPHTKCTCPLGCRCTIAIAEF